MENLKNKDNLVSEDNVLHYYEPRSYINNLIIFSSLLQSCYFFYVKFILLRQDFRFIYLLSLFNFFLSFCFSEISNSVATWLHSRSWNRSTYISKTKMAKPKISYGLPVCQHMLLVASSCIEECSFQPTLRKGDKTLTKILSAAAIVRREVLMVTCIQTAQNLILMFHLILRTHCNILVLQLQKLGQ